MDGSCRRRPTSARSTPAAKRPTTAPSRTPAAADIEPSERFPTDTRTDRLRLRRFQGSDADWYAAMNADAGVMRFIHDGQPYRRDESDASLAKIIGHWERHGFGLWAAERLDTEEPIGFVGLAIPTFLPRVLPAVEIGWRLAPVHWRQGFATEAAVVAIEHGFETLGLDEIVSITVHDNLASQRVMARLGLELRCREVHPAQGIVVEVRSISAERWSARSTPATPATPGALAPAPGTG